MGRLKINKNPTEDEIKNKFKKAQPDYLLKAIGDVLQDGTGTCLATDKKTGKWRTFYVRVVLE